MIKQLASNLFSLGSPGVILLVTWFTYLPALRIGFLDGWWYLEWAARFPFLRYLIQFVDPAYITQGYRPVQGLYMYLLYRLWGFNADGFHYAHNLLHAANALLTFLIVWRLGRHRRVAFVAALIYTVLPNYSLAVFWHAVVDPLAGFFYLLTMLLWTRYLDTRRVRDYVLTFGTFVFALFSKEIAIFLPLFLFLIEWWFYRVQPGLRAFAPRYAPFLITFIPYLYLVYQVQSHGEFAGQFGFRIGSHMLGNLIPYAAVLACPWFTGLPDDSLAYVWLAIVTVVYVGIMIYRRSVILLFLALFAVLNIAPLLGFPLDYFAPRYLYLSTIVSAISIALVFEGVWQLVNVRRGLVFLVIFALGSLVVFSSLRVVESAEELAEYTRQLRVPYREITRLHSTFPQDSYIYFVYSPRTPLSDLQGLFMTRYGLDLRVSGTEVMAPADLRKHRHTFVYYFDEKGHPREIVVTPRGDVQVTPTLPLDFDAQIRLESVEVVNPIVRSGEPLIILFTWRALRVPEQAYTIFVHLTDSQGNVLAQYDTPPRRGEIATDQLHVGELIVDAHLLAFEHIPPGVDYRIAIGLYDPAIMRRLKIVNATSQDADSVVITPIRID